MSDTATELLEMDIEPLTLDDSTGRGRTLDDVTALDHDQEFHCER